MNNCEPVVSILLEYCADLNRQSLTGNTPLHIAATRNAKECVKWLLTRGADRSIKNGNGQTPDQVAALSGGLEICDIIKKFKNEEISK